LTGKGLALVLALGLQRLVGFRLGGFNQISNGLNTFVGSLDCLQGLPHVVEQVAQIACAGVKPRGGEERVRIVESRVDLEASRQFVLDAGHQVCGGLKCEKVLPHGS